MQWKYLFTHKSPNFQAPRKISSLFTCVLYSATPSEVSSLGVAEPKTNVNKQLISHGAWRLGLLWINKYDHCIYWIFFHKGAQLQTSQRPRACVFYKSNPTSLCSLSLPLDDTSISWSIVLGKNVLSYDCNINVLKCLTYYYIIGFRILEWVKVWCIIGQDLGIGKPLEI